MIYICHRKTKKTANKTKIKQTMKKFTLLMAIAAVFTSAAIAQENRFSAGVELAMPMGDFADAAGFGFGASLRYEIPIGEQLGFIPTIGVLSFGGEEIESGFPGIASFKTETTNLMFPIQVGLKYYFMEAQDGFYADIETGVHIVSSKIKTEIDLLGVKSTSEETASDTNFGVAPGIGYHLANVDIGLRYQLLFAKASATFTDPVTGTTTTVEDNVTNSYIGVRLAYVFGER